MWSSARKRAKTLHSNCMHCYRHSVFETVILLSIVMWVLTSLALFLFSVAAGHFNFFLSRIAINSTDLCPYYAYIKYNLFINIHSPPVNVCSTFSSQNKNSMTALCFLHVFKENRFENGLWIGKEKLMPPIFFICLKLKKQKHK